MRTLIVLLLWVRLGMGVIAMKEYPTDVQNWSLIIRWTLVS